VFELKISPSARAGTSSKTSWASLIPMAPMIMSVKPTTLAAHVWISSRCNLLQGKYHIRRLNQEGNKIKIQWWLGTFQKSAINSLMCTISETKLRDFCNVRILKLIQLECKVIFKTTEVLIVFWLEIHSTNSHLGKGFKSYFGLRGGLTGPWVIGKWGQKVSDQHHAHSPRGHQQRNSVALIAQYKVVQVLRDDQALLMYVGLLLSTLSKH
jgi:hypothetical protein